MDEFSILQPLIQCCRIRYSTLQKLLKLYLGPEKLSDLLDESMKDDPVYPILTRGHLEAVDRRVLHILRAVYKCVQKYSVDIVVVDDGF